ncbi:MAG TPA: FHA domain-containing protein [Thermoanaerobaculia bacterium]|nr:FHA domain-containing protein [Thermoanaerobaculia bacterium]
MPLIRCPKCGQAYDIPGVIAVRLPNSIATCHCGEWLAGSKAAVLARMLNPQEIKEVDLQPYRVEMPALPHEQGAVVGASDQPFEPRTVRIITSGVKQPLNAIFTIYEYPLLVGRKGCHVEIEGAELSIRHFSLSVRGKDLVVRDFDSHMGTFLDGQQVDEAVLGDGVHIIRAGNAVISVEPVNELGRTVEPIHLEASELVDESQLAKTRRESAAPAAAAGRIVLICIEGALSGQEFEIPPTGLVVGREGHVRVPDEFLSRKHFEVAPDPEGVIRVRDLGSRNGTFLNTLPATNTKVQAGDEIRAGVNRFRIEHR